MAARPPDGVAHPRAFLVRVAVNHALERLAAVGRSRQTCVGPRLPEPLVTDEDAGGVRAGRGLRLSARRDRGDHRPHSGGGNDVVATRFHLSINTVTWVVRIAVFVVPVAVLAVTRRICLGLRLCDRELVARGRATGVVKRLPHGEYVEVHKPLDRARLHTLTARERPVEHVEHGPAAERPPARRDGG
ncbi:hypothetical protein SUDANB15_06825 [Streptomyces sp. enrichment culture]|uniref:hypothetical protein n=1 Tax=Streptomyces sp. enrichment culture TaxID=1795815 RepID=UPI003F56D293